LGGAFAQLALKKGCIVVFGPDSAGPEQEYPEGRVEMPHRQTFCRI